MESNSIIVATIGAVGLIIAALIAREGFWQRIRPKKFKPLRKKWESSWIDAGGKRREKEILYITNQTASKISGNITMEKEPDMKWDFEGRFTEGFLQIMYFPAKDLEDRRLDFGVYFLKEKLDGTFEGDSLSVYWNKDSSEIVRSKHWLKVPVSKK